MQEDNNNENLYHDKAYAISSSTKYYSYFKLFSTIASIFAIIISGIVIFGWIFGISPLRGDIYGLSAMKFNGAILFILCGLTLFLRLKEYSNTQIQFLTKILPFIALGLALVTASEYLFGVNLGIDQLFVKDTSLNLLENSPLGRIPILANLEFILLSISLILLNLRKILLSQFIVIIAIFFAMTTILAFTYNTSTFLVLESAAAIPLYSAITFLILCLGIFFSLPGRKLMKLITDDNSGSSMLRKILPYIIIIPIVLGWLTFIGYQMKLYHTGFGLALLVISTFILLTFVIAWNAYNMNRNDRLRLEALGALSESEERNRLLVENAGLGISYFDTDGKIILHNKIATSNIGADPKDIVGKTVFDLFDEQQASLYMDRIKTALKSPDSNVYEDHMPSPTEDKWFLSTFTKMTNSKGDIIGTQIISNDISQLKNVENQLKSSLKEKEMLLKEIHHRVKNNLMIISSLLNLQSRYIKDKESQDIFKESQNRARSMALIHERLYQSTDLKRIDFGNYIQTLSNELYHTYVADPRLIELKINVENIFIDINTTVPLGLIVNELITNSIKHAFPEGKSGKVNIDFLHKDDHYEFTVKDNGIGFPEDLDFRNTDSLGLQMVNSLTEQIDGKIELNNNHGTEFQITFAETKIS